MKTLILFIVLILFSLSTENIFSQSLWNEDFNIGTISPNPTAGPSFTTSNGTWTTGGANGNVWKHSFYTTSGEWSTGTTPFVSTTAANGFMLFDSDSVNFPVSPNYSNYMGELISPVINLTGAGSALLTLDQNFRWCCSQGTNLVTVSVSTDGGLSWGAPYDLNPGMTANQDYGTTSGGYFMSVDISAQAAGNMVNLKFKWDGIAAGNSHYFWNIDDINIEELLNDDLEILSAVFVGQNNGGIYYGRTPLDQLDPNYIVGSEVQNIGVSTQTNVALSADYISFIANSSIPSLNQGASSYLSSIESLVLGTGLYQGTHTVVSTEETGGPAFSNNSRLRNFEVTDFTYSQDGIGVHPAADLVVSSIGTNSFAGGEDGLVCAAMYHIKQITEFSGIRVMLAVGTVVGGEIYGSIKDTLTFQTNDMTSIYVATPYIVTAADITNGFVDITFPNNITLNPGGYYAAIELYSNANANDIVIMDDLTVTQPFLASAIYIPGDQVYSNGEAFGIRLEQADCPGFSANVISSQNNICNGASNGSAVAEAVGGVGPFIYEWSNGIFNDSINGLSAGTYTITITEASGCQTTAIVIITEPNAMTSTSIVNNVSCNGFSDGSIDFTLFGGAGNYTFDWNSGTYLTEDISGLIAGSYILLATDAIGCIHSETINITEPNAVDVNTSTLGATITATNVNPGLAYQWVDCDSNFVIIPGETGQSFTATVNGNYAVIINENGCVDTSMCVAMTSIGLIENDFGVSFNISPNPTSGDLVVTLGDIYSTIDVKIFDMKGRLTNSYKFNQSDQLNLTLDGTAGYYMLDITASGKRARIKVLKK